VEKTHPFLKKNQFFDDTLLGRKVMNSLINNQQSQVWDNFQNSQYQLTFSGHIDDAIDFTLIQKKIESINPKSISFNLEKVSQLNSCGIRNWLLFINQIKSIPLEFYDLSESFVEQMNIVPNMVGDNAKCHSFFVPYFCETCDERTTMKYLESTWNGEIASKNCDSCQKPLEFDGIEEEYFSFLKQVKKSAY